MDQLAFDVTNGEHGHEAKTFAILINGERLESLARAVEQPFADAEGKPDLAGDYEPLSLYDIDSDLDHFRGKPVARWFGDGDSVLMGCPCGEWGCWPLTAHIAVTEETVTWHRFRNGHRPWDLRALGPFVFDRTEYEVALSTLG